ncbi:YtkA-like [Lentibacillus halodurans]|uniref:YtkA-like n=1 Tax=Lentibacillus halodurans TaxID=237679 RepID=A0A1I0WIN9_9BACI|nr:FixH family protein [Lentibacillus halodurans]SFA88645.1 YtkA-like [Lentibacillus halodurans]
MRKLTMICFIMIIALLGACGQTENTDHETSDEPDTAKPIEADLEVPEQGKKNEPVTFTVTVTQDGEAVSDASEVEFEIWQDGNKDESEMIEADNANDGQYTIEKTFTAEGVYHVQSHVTARSMHTMPVKEITVGNAEAAVQTNKGSEGEESHSHSHASIDLQQPDTITAGSETPYAVQVLHQNEPLENASVTLETWRKNDNKHEWTDLNEDTAGTYEGSVTFTESGTYHINVHVEKEEIHKHEEFTAEVAD